VFPLTVGIGVSSLWALVSEVESGVWLWQEERDELEAERQEAIVAAREEETARLRAQQEKAQDKQAGIDELRAVRAAESYERQWRMKVSAVEGRPQGGG
jgi:hypothetical protein